MPVSDRYENFARLEVLLRHIGNSRLLPPFHEIRAQAVEARTALERALGDDYRHIFETKLSKSLP